VTDVQFKHNVGEGLGNAVWNLRKLVSLEVHWR